MLILVKKSKQFGICLEIAISSRICILAMSSSIQVSEITFHWEVVAQHKLKEEENKIHATDQ